MTFELVKVVNVRSIGGHRLRVSFSDGTSGVHDFSELVSEPGPMIEPLRDSEFFGKVFLEMGVPTWPNGFDMDAIKLHMDMAAAGELNQVAAE